MSAAGVLRPTCHASVDRCGSVLKSGAEWTAASRYMWRLDAQVTRCPTREGQCFRCLVVRGRAGIYLCSARSIPQGGWPGSRGLPPQRLCRQRRQVTGQCCQWRGFETAGMAGSGRPCRIDCASCLFPRDFAPAECPAMIALRRFASRGGTRTTHPMRDFPHSGDSTALRMLSFRPCPARRGGAL